MNLTYPVINLGTSTLTLYNFFFGKFVYLRKFTMNNFYNNFYLGKIKIENPCCFFMGTSSISRIDLNFLVQGTLYFLNKLRLSFKNINIISESLGRISALEYGVSCFSKICKKQKFQKIFRKKFLYLNNLNNLNYYLNNSNTSYCFIVLQGSFECTNFFF